MTRVMITHPASTAAAGRRADLGNSGDWARHTILAASKPRLPAVDRDERAISDEGAVCPASWVVTALSVERGSSPQFAISNSLPCSSPRGAIPDFATAKRVASLPCIHADQGGPRRPRRPGNGPWQDRRAGSTRRSDRDAG